MRSRLWSCGAAFLATWLWAAALAGQSATGPTKATKASVAEADNVWVSWTEDEVVSRLVYEPIKVLGLRPFGRDERLALKRLVVRTEARVRSLVGSLSSGEMGIRAARESMADTIAQYVATVERLSTPR